MARDTLDDTPIEGRQQLVDWFLPGEKPADTFRIGTEHEKFGFDLKTHAPLPYEGPNGIGEILRRMQSLTGWDAIEERGNIIGLADASGGGAISVEPGGQFELSGAPLETLHQTCREANQHLNQVRQISDDLNVGFLGVGVAPEWSRAQMPMMPKQRYEIMTAYMPTVGTRGLDMMYRTSTIQVNLDFSSEADMVKKMRVGLALQPIATALFANSPFIDGAANGVLSNRAEIWLDVDLQRSGPIPFAFEDGFGYERYVDYALQVPMYFVKRGDHYIRATHATFGQFMNGQFDGLPGERPNMGDWVNHLSTLFPDVRLKRFLEMRGADGGPWRRICALPALWVGLLYDSGVLDEAVALCQELTAEDRAHLWRTVPREGLKAKAGQRTAQDLARDAVGLARKGLARRARSEGDSRDETDFLGPVEDVVHSGITPAQELLSAYKGPWKGDLSHIYSTYAF
ncbi:MAG: glutamate--cysteine ligase [Pseudomonadota bacterium]